MPVPVWKLSVPASVVPKKWNISKFQQNISVSTLNRLDTEIQKNLKKNTIVNEMKESIM